MENNNNNPINDPSPLKSNKDNYRIANRKRLRGNRNNIREERQLDNGEEIEKDDENDQEDQNVRKRNIS